MRTQREFVVNYKVCSGIDKNQDTVRLMRPRTTEVPVYTLKDCINADVDATGALLRRLGRAQLKSGTGYHSIKGWDDICLVAKDNTLLRYDEDFTSTTTLFSGLQNLWVTYARTGYDIYFSDLSTIGIIRNGTYMALPSVTYGVTRPTLQRWLAQTRINTPPGQILEIFAHRLWSASGRVLHYSDPFAYHRVSKHRGHIPFEGMITMVKAVSDGMFISADSKLYFLAGQEISNQKVINLANYGAVFGAVCDIEPSLFAKETKPAIMFLTEKGICTGGDGGQFENLTIAKYPDITAKQGAALFRSYVAEVSGQSRTIHQFLTSYQN